MPDNQTDNPTPIKSGHHRFRPVGEKTTEPGAPKDSRRKVHCQEMILNRFSLQWSGKFQENWKFKNI